MNDLLSPLKSVVLSNLAYRRQDGNLATDCPECGATLHIVGPSFVCSNTATCSFSRGSSLDFLARTTGSYLSAVELAAQEIPFYRDRIEVEARKHEIRRRLTDFSLEAERSNSSMDIERHKLRSNFLQFMQVSSMSFGRGHWFLTTEQSNRLVLILSEMDVTPPPNLQGRPTAIAPYWGTLHSIGQLYVLSGNFQSFKICPVEPYKVSWFGLQQMDPRNRSIVVLPTYSDAMAREEYHKVCDYKYFPSSVHVNAQASQNGLAFETLRFMAQEHEWLTVLLRWSMLDEFETADFELEDGRRIKAMELMGKLFKDHLHQMQPFIDACGGMRMSQPLRNHILKLAEQHIHVRSVLQSLKNTLSRKLLAVDEKGSIYECANGYYVETAGVYKQATNFTLSLERMVCFSSLTEARYAGKVFLGEHEFRFEATGQKMENSSQFEELLRTTQTLQGLSEGNVTVMSSKEFRRVLEALRIVRGELPRYQGVSSLGWNHRFDTFFFPHAIVDQQGIRGNVTYHADESGEHHCYVDTPPLPDTLPDTMPELDPLLAEIVSILVSQMLRIYHAKQVRLWPVRNNEGRDNALRLFSGFGQTSLMRLTQFSTRNFELNRGMPCLVALQNELQAGKARMAGLYLSDHGHDLRAFDRDQIDTAAMTIPALIAEIARRLIAKEPVSFVEKRSVEPMSAVAAEGAELIRRDFWPLWPEVGQKWSSINRLLGEKEETIPRMVQIDLSTSTILFPSALWQDIELDATDLAIEMGLMNLKTQVSEHGIRVDRGTMNKVFTDFYGKVPELIAL